MKKLKRNKEWLEQREERKALWLAKATQHFDTPKIRREAIKIFNKANSI